MPEYIFFLGSHSELSLLEIESLLGKRSAIQNLSSPLPLNFFDRMGGIERVGIILDKQTSQYSPEQLLSLLSPLPRKFMLGLNASESFAFEIKKLVQAQDSKVKFVLPKSKNKMLNAAQVIFNKLDQEPNAEINLIQQEQGWLVVKTIWIQDIRAYEVRDTSRPARFGKVGMLPPKLAQMMINFAVGIESGYLPAGRQVLDPFCGMGTILQEGQLMGYNMFGSDIAQEMIEASKRNLQWLAEHFNVSNDPKPIVFQHDATRPFGPKLSGKFDAIVTEPYLGPPLRSSSPSHPEELGNLYIQAFRNFWPVLKPSAKVVFVMPVLAQRRGQDFVFFPVVALDAIAKLGYRRLQPLGLDRRLLYARPDALVGREITIWEKK